MYRKILRQAYTLLQLCYKKLLLLGSYLHAYYNTRSSRQKLLTVLVILPLFLFLITACGGQGGPNKGK